MDSEAASFVSGFIARITGDGATVPALQAEPVEIA